MNKLKELREQKGFSQFELARITNIYPQKISNFECGKKDLRLGEAVQIANALNVSVDDLIKPTQSGDCVSE